MKKRIYFFHFILYFIIIILNFSCKRKEEKNVSEQQPQVVLPQLPDFNADSAYAFVKAQSDFGPRVPNTKAHVACGNYLVSRMREWCDTVIVQQGKITAFDGTVLNFKNVLSSFNPQAKNRILLFAHWDTRPWADQDSVEPDKSFDGSDDGGSGVAVLMEIARQLKTTKTDVGVDLAFFDAEDWGKEGGGEGSEDSYALGTQYWAKNLHVANYNASYAILLDMVGAKGAHFRKEGLSREQAGFVVDRVWGIASKLGFSGYFLFADGGWVTDDHVYVNKINIPAIDIIHSDLGSRTGFPSHWHTHRDNMDVIDPVTLKAVGQTLIGVIFYPSQI